MSNLREPSENNAEIARSELEYAARYREEIATKAEINRATYRLHRGILAALVALVDATANEKPRI